MAQSKRRFVDYRVLFQAVTVKVLFQAVTVKGIVPSSHCQGYYSKQSLSRPFTIDGDGQSPAGLKFRAILSSVRAISHGPSTSESTLVTILDRLN